MIATEKVYWFMIDKLALEGADTAYKEKLQALGDLLSTTPLVLVLQERFIAYTLVYIKKVGQFKVRSYHGLNG
eukprot:8487936-Ditylum_brightwellii.AAC.1